MHKMVAFRCLDCGTYNIFMERTADGHKCLNCNGMIVWAGYAIDGVKRRRTHAKQTIAPMQEARVPQADA